MNRRRHSPSLECDRRCRGSPLSGLIGGLFVRQPVGERAEFLRHLGRDARQITGAELAFLLRYNGRARVVAGWMIGLDRRTQFRERVGKTLLAGDSNYACEAYCIALTMLGTPEDAALLAASWTRATCTCPKA